MPTWTVIDTANVIAAVASVALFATGTVLLLRDDKAAKRCAVAFGFGFLLVVLLVCTRFKHFEGFGFKADLIEQKEIELSQMTDELSFLAQQTAQQTALLASRMGYWDSSFSIPELLDILDHSNAIIETTKIPDDKKSELTQPIITRISQNYILAAHRILVNAYNSELRAIPEQKSPGDNSKVNEIIQQRNAAEKLNSENPSTENSIKSFIDFVTKYPVGAQQDVLLNHLTELDDDLNYFNQYHRLRRKIDLKTYYPDSVEPAVLSVE